VMIEWQRSSRPRVLSGRVLGAGVFLVAIAAIMGAFTLAQGRQAPGRDVAQAISMGRAHGADAAGDADDPDLAADEAAAGQLWARKNRPADASDCPSYPAAFRRGCVQGFVERR